MKTNYFSILAFAVLLFFQTSCSSDSSEIIQDKTAELINNYQYTIAENELVVAEIAKK